MDIFTSTTLLKCSKSASRKKTSRHYYSRSTKAPTDTMRATLVAKAFRVGFYWKTVMRNAEDIMRCCIASQNSPVGPTRQHQNLKQYHSPGPLQHEDSTWLVH